MYEITKWDNVKQNALVILDDKKIEFKTTRQWISNNFKTDGKWYFEIQWVSGSTGTVGVARTNSVLNASITGSSSNGTNVTLYNTGAIYPSGGTTELPYTLGTSVGVLLDIDNKQLRFKVNERISQANYNISGWSSFYPYVRGNTGNETFILKTNKKEFSQSIPEGYFPLDETFEEKTIFYHNNEYKIWNGSWQTLSNSLPSAHMFNNSGMDDLKILDRVGNYSPLDDLVGGFETLTWVNKPSETLQLSLDVSIIPNPQLVYPKDSVSLVGVEFIDNLTLLATGDAKITPSFDEGLSWKAYRNSSWITVDNARDGMSVLEFNNLTRNQITEVRDGSNSIRFSYYLSNGAKVDNLEMKVSLQGTEKLATSNTFDIEYNENTSTIIYNIKKNGTYSVNYVT